MSMHTSMHRILTFKEVSAYTGLGVGTLYKMTVRRQIPYTKM